MVFKDKFTEQFASIQNWQRQKTGTLVSRFTVVTHKIECVCVPISAHAHVSAMTAPKILTVIHAFGCFRKGGEGSGVSSDDGCSG